MKPGATRAGRSATRSAVTAEIRGIEMVAAALLAAEHEIVSPVLCSEKLTNESRTWWRCSLVKLHERLRELVERLQGDRGPDAITIRRSAVDLRRRIYAGLDSARLANNKREREERRAEQERLERDRLARRTARRAA